MKKFLQRKFPLPTAPGLATNRAATTMPAKSQSTPSKSQSTPAKSPAIKLKRKVPESQSDGTPKKQKVQED